MIKQIIICDKCGVELNEDRKQINGLDLCECCHADLCNVIQQWIYSEEIEEPEIVIEQAYEEPDAEENETAAPEEMITDQTDEPVEEATEEIKEEPKEEKPKKEKRKYARSPKKNSPVDWDKACALKKAEWSNRWIADELGINVAYVNTAIYQKVREYDDRQAEKEAREKAKYMEER